VTIDEDLAITECQQHLFGLAGLDIYWSKLAPLNLVLGLLFGLRGIVVVVDVNGLYQPARQEEWKKRKKEEE
jgi:hypothetical protein